MSWSMANGFASLAELSAGSLKFKSRTTRKQAAFHGPMPTQLRVL